jgi:hypothetical protein
MFIKCIIDSGQYSLEPDRALGWKPEIKKIISSDSNERNKALGMSESKSKTSNKKMKEINRSRRPSNINVQSSVDTLSKKNILN